MTRESFSKRRTLIAAVVISASVLASCGNDDANADSNTQQTSDTSAAASQTGSGDAAAPAAGDVAKLTEQAANFRTLGMPDDWNNFGKFFDAMCSTYKLGCVGTGVGPNRFDTDMSSAEEIAAFKEEKEDPGVCADIGIAFGQVAESEKVLIDYLPAAADKLPAAYKADTGGWVASATGVISFVVNTDVITNVPKTWADLLKPEYAGKISISNPVTSGTGQAMVFSSAAALGGGKIDLDGAMKYWNEMYTSGQINEAEYSNAALEKGETPITIRYDYVGLIAAKEINDKAGKDVISVTIPDDGGVYAPSATMCNVATDSPELAKAILDFTLSDEGQLIFAENGARPIRYVLGDLEVPENLKASWLPDSEYEKVVSYPDNEWPEPGIVAERWENEVLA
jgi:putative spermidine/putrescine transport system substrate-binding protein